MNKNFNIFKAAYFADLKTLKNLILSKSDLIIVIPVPEGDYKLYWEKDYFELSVIEILNWQNFNFYEYYDSYLTGYKSINAKNEVYEVNFNPSIHYKKP